MELENSGTFVGYKLRQLEETLAQMHVVLRSLQRKAARIEQKIGVLGSGMTPEEIKAAIAALEADAKQVEEANVAIAALGGQAHNTGV